MFRLSPFLAGCCATLLLSGCASWSGHGVVPQSGEYPVVLLPARFTAHVERLSQVAPPPPTPEATPGDANVDESEAIRAQRTAAVERVTSSLARRLDASDILRTWVAPAESLTDADGIPLSPAAVARNEGAAAALQVDISGYGRLKPGWVALLLAKGAVEATAHGVIAWQVLDNHWAALGLFLEELAVETLTWGGSAKLFDAHYSPVILEARLIAAEDGKTVWKEMVVVPTDRKRLKKLPEAERGRRDVQLQLTSERAVRRLAKTLDKAALHRLHPPSRPRLPGLRAWSSGGG